MTRLQRMRWSGTTDVLGWSREFFLSLLRQAVTVASVNSWSVKKKGKKVLAKVSSETRRVAKATALKTTSKSD